MTLEFDNTISCNDDENDNKEYDTYQETLETRLYINDFFKQINHKLSQKKWKEKMKTMRTLCEYITTFGTDSVQGTAGIIQLKNDKKSKVYFLTWVNLS